PRREAAPVFSCTSGAGPGREPSAAPPCLASSWSRSCPGSIRLDSPCWCRCPQPNISGCRRSRKSRPLAICSLPLAKTKNKNLTTKDTKEGHRQQATGRREEEPNPRHSPQKTQKIRG